jgi:hypothetical protein
VDYAPSARGSGLNFVNFVRYQSYKKALRSAVNLQLEQALFKIKTAKISLHCFAKYLFTNPFKSLLDGL